MKKLLICLVSCALAILVSCSDGTDPDTTPPKVVSTNPTDQYDSASAYDPITAIFSETIYPNSVDTSTFTLSATGSGLTLSHQVRGAVITSGRSVTFAPETNLDFSTGYVATLKAGIRDMAGNAMTSDYVWSFTTADFHPGTSWMQRESGSTDFLYSVDRSDSRFVAVGYSGTILASSDGIGWDSVSSEVDKTLLDVLWTGEQFIAVGINVIASSPDGMSWTEIKRIDATGGFWLEGVAYSGEKLVAVDSRAGRVLSSIDDGESWIEEYGTVSGRVFWEITWSGSMFVAVGAINYSAMVATSVDGIEWSYADLGIEGDLFDVTWTGSQLVAVGGETLPVDGAAVVTSPDGVTWTERHTGTINPLYAVWSAGSTIIAVGYEGTILTSEDGIDWTERTSGTQNTLWGMTSSEKRVVVVGAYGAILTSQ